MSECNLMWIKGDCWASVEVCTLLSGILVFKIRWATCKCHHFAYELYYSMFKDCFTKICILV